MRTEALPNPDLKTIARIHPVVWMVATVLAAALTGIAAPSRFGWCDFWRNEFLDGFPNEIGSHSDMHRLKGTDQPQGGEK